MDALQTHIIHEMQLGYRATYRGHEWGREQMGLLEEVGTAVEVAFHLLKALQFPEGAVGRFDDIKRLRTDTPMLRQFHH